MLFPFNRFSSLLPNYHLEKAGKFLKSPTPRPLEGRGRGKVRGHLQSFSLSFSTSQMVNGQWLMVNGFLPFFVPDVNVLVLLGQDFIGIGDGRIADENWLCHHLASAERHCQRWRGNICLFHLCNLLFDNLLFTIYLQFYYLVIYKTGEIFLWFNCT